MLAGPRKGENPVTEIHQRDLAETVPGQIAGTRAQRFRSPLSHPGR